MRDNQLNRIKFSSATTGTGSSIAATTRYSDAHFLPQEAANPAVVNGQRYTYIIQQGTNIEIQENQTWVSAGNTIARGTPVVSRIGGTIGTTQITLDNTAIVTFGVSANDLMFDHFKGADIASAATIDLQNASGFVVDVTGTTSITAITLNSGQRRLVRFTGALTLTDNSVIDLPGGANIVTAAGDFAEFVGFPASVVKCSQYTRADGRSVVQTFATTVTPAVNDGAALGTTSLGFSDLHLADGGLINWANNKMVIDGNTADAMGFSGAANGYRFDAYLAPSANDVASLGISTLCFSDVFLAAGAVINFNSDVLITHSTDALTFSGAPNGFYFSHFIAPSVTDGAALGASAAQWSDLWLAPGGIINFAANDVMIVHATNQLQFQGASAGYVFDAFLCPLTDDGAALGTTSNRFSDIFFASGAVINFAAGNYTATHSTGLLTFSGPIAATGVQISSGGTINFASSDVIITHSTNALAFTGAATGYTFDGRTAANDVAGGTPTGNAMLASKTNSSNPWAMVAYSTLSGQGGGCIILRVDDSSEEYIKYFAGGLTTGRVHTDDGVNTLYVNSSDKSLKFDEKPYTDSGWVIDNTTIWDFAWRSKPERRNIGVFAQDEYLVFPDAVSFSVDPNEPAGIDYSKYVPVLLEELKQLRKRVAELESRL
jgi:hypothetical protein